MSTTKSTTKPATKKSLVIKDGTEHTGEVVKKARLKHSLFMLTVNTNQSFPDTHAAEFIKAKKEFTEALVSRVNYDTINDYLKFEEGSAANIESTDLDAALERGDRAKLLHAHLMIHITHRCKLKFNIEKFRSEVNEELGRTCYMNIKTQAAGVANLKDYIAKGLKGADKMNYSSLDPLHVGKGGSGASSSDTSEPRLLDSVSKKPEVIDKVIEKAMKDPKLAKRLEGKFNELSEMSDKLTILLHEKGPDSIAMKSAAKDYLRAKLKFIDQIDKQRTGRSYDEPTSVFKSLFKKWFAEYIVG